MSNPYKTLLSLLPPRQLYIGDVLSFSGGVAVVEILGSGATVKARAASATVGQRVYVRDGVIEGPAPTLSFVTAEV
jgi:hypothetical protein